jgi:hypothetical protein
MTSMLAQLKRWGVYIFCFSEMTLVSAVQTREKNRSKDMRGVGYMFTDLIHSGIQGYDPGRPPRHERKRERERGGAMSSSQDWRR